MNNLDLAVCNIIDTIAKRVSDELPCEPLPVDTTTLPEITDDTDGIVNDIQLDQDEMCEIILKYKDCYDFDTLPKPFFFYKKYPEYYTIDVGGVSYEKFIELIEGADDYKNCSSTEERRTCIRNRLVKTMCYHYKMKGFLPDYEKKYWEGTRYLEFTEKSYIEKLQN